MKYTSVSRKTWFIPFVVSLLPLFLPSSPRNILVFFAMNYLIWSTTDKLVSKVWGFELFYVNLRVKGT